MMRKVWHAVTAAVSLSLVCTGELAAQAAPEFPKVVTMVVPFSPGASNDIFARAFAEKLGKNIGSTIIIENMPGAGGSIGAQAVARSKPDGGTVLWISPTFTSNAAITTDPNIDPMKSFEPVAMLAQAPMIVGVGARTPYLTFKELIGAAKARPGSINYGSAGVGSITHLVTAAMNSQANVEMTHIPYKGLANAVTDLIGGQIELVIASYATLGEQIKANHVRPLAVTSEARVSFEPNVPTVAETIPGFSASQWWGVLAPAGTPAPLLERLNKETLKVVHLPEMQKVFLEERATPATDHSPGDFGQMVRSEIQRWREVAKKYNIKPQ